MAFVKFGKRFMKNGRPFRKAISTAPAVRKAIRKVKNTALARKVLTVVNRHKESKYCGELDQNALGLVQGVTVPGELYRMVPRTTQGVADHQRIGNTIEPKKAHLYLTLNFDTSDAFAVDQWVNILILRVKGAQTAATVAQTPAASLLRFGNGTNTDPNSPNQQEMLSIYNNLPVNPDQFTLLKRYRFRMSKGVGFLNSVGAPIPPDCPTISSQSSVKFIKYSWTPPALHYNAAGDTLPSNHYPVWCAWATNTDGSPTQTKINISSRLEMYYKDA